MMTELFVFNYGIFHVKKAINKYFLLSLEKVQYQLFAMISQVTIIFINPLKVYNINNIKG